MNFINRLSVVRTMAFSLCLICIFSSFAMSKSGYIRYVEFNPTVTVLEQAMEYDIVSHTEKDRVEVSWIDLLAYAAAKNGGQFTKTRSNDIDNIYKRLSEGESIEAITKDMEYFSYYQKAYNAVLSEFLGWHDIETWDENAADNKSIVHKYGLKVFSPIAAEYSFSHYEDFGASRSYGYRRPHLGNDLLGSIGTPIIAVEGGIIEALGWNMYGGWRIGIRSFDGARYYYYAHLRSKHPYNNTLDVGSVVSAGDVIGYMGMTGYSRKEGVNNIETPHLHFGMQLIFDEVQKDGSNQIWIDVYALTEFLKRNQSAVKKTDNGEYNRFYRFADRSNTESADQVFSEISNVDNKKIYPLTILMYHSLNPDSKFWGKYVIPPSLFEDDIIYLKSHGYNIINISDLIDFTDKGINLPEKAVLITLDDGYYNNYSYLPEILSRQKVSATVAVVGQFTDTYSEKSEKSNYYGIASWKELSYMKKCGYIDLANHSYNQHSGEKTLSGNAFYCDVVKMQKTMLTNLGNAAIAYAYPFGKIPENGDEILKSAGIRISFSCAEKKNHITDDAETLFSLGRYNRPYGISTEDFMKKVLS